MVPRHPNAYFTTLTLDGVVGAASPSFGRTAVACACSGVQRRRSTRHRVETLTDLDDRVGELL
jgi:hypothetical protein